MAGIAAVLVAYPRDAQMPHGFLLPHDSLSAAHARGTLRVAGRIDPSTLAMDDVYGPSGITYELADAFARHLGLRLELALVDSGSELHALLGSGAVDLAVLSSEERLQEPVFRAGTPILEIEQIVVHRIDRHGPRTLADLVGQRVMTVAQSAAAEALRRRQTELPALAWEESTRMDTFELLREAAAGAIDYAVVNANEFLLLQELFPGLQASIAVDRPDQLSWAVADRGGDDPLSHEIERFLASREADGQLDLLRERYFAHMPEIARHALGKFAERVSERLPKLEPLLRRVGAQEGIDWQLLAAIAYQESHWNPVAVSRTGVAGMMMLTQSTARAMGVRDRRNMEQSLRGGARYFRSLLAELPADIAEPDRTLFALAAYNMGPAHVEDARRLARLHDRDPAQWEDVAEQLPLLARREWRRHTRHGYARGYEALAFVQRVQHYHRYLAAHTEGLDDSEALQLAMNAGTRRARGPDRG